MGALHCRDHVVPTVQRWPGTVEDVNRAVLTGIGVLLVVVGVVWFLQGIDVLGGSGMSGKTLWAVVGPIVALGGVALVVVARRRTPPGE